MKKSFLLILALGFLFCSCSEQSLERDDMGKYIFFNVADNSEGLVTVKADSQSSEMEADSYTDKPFILSFSEMAGWEADNPDTRGSLVTSAADLSFGVSEYNNSDAAVSALQNVSPTYSASTTPCYTTSVPWESAAYAATPQSYKFYAYYPHIATAGSKQTNGLTLNSGHRTLSYDATGISVANQPDLMTAYAESSYSRSGVSLGFKHRLCGVRIKIGSTWRSGWRINAIRFGNISYAGTVDINGSWSSLTTGAYTVTGFTEAGDPGEDAAAYLMMIPQDVSSSIITIGVTNGVETGSFRADLSGTWKEGETVTYTLTWGDDDVILSALYMRWTPTDGSAAVDGPVTQYEYGQSFGVFAVDNATKKVVYVNQLMTAETTGVSPNLSGSNNVKRTYTFYVYYPYQSVNPTSYTVDQTLSDPLPSAFDFFNSNSFITNWSVQTDQSTYGQVVRSDLQIGKVNGADAPNRPVRAEMNHVMGLAKVALKTTSESSIVRTYTSKAAPHDTYTEESGAEYQKTATSALDATSPENALHASGNLWRVVKATGVDSSDGTITLKSEQTDQDKWNEGDISFSGIGYGKIKSEDATSQRHFAWAAEFYYNGTGSDDIGYSDGAYYVLEAPYTGNYKLEVYGAQGGDGRQWNTHIHVNNSGGKGGYSYGVASLNAGDRLYVCVGGRGRWAKSVSAERAPGGFNGGGTGGTETENFPENAAAGGGATHIATSLRGTGVLSDYSSYQDDVLIVAGGGGGASGCFQTNWAQYIAWHPYDNLTGNPTYADIQNAHIENYFYQFTAQELMTTYYQYDYRNNYVGESPYAATWGALLPAQQKIIIDETIYACFGGQGGGGNNPGTATFWPDRENGEKAGKRAVGGPTSSDGTAFFGRGMDGYEPPNHSGNIGGTGGGGGGWYGGYYKGTISNPVPAAGAGGSGYIKSTLGDRGGTTGEREGQGFARITYIP